MADDGPGGAVGYVRGLAADWELDRADDAELVRRFVADRSDPAFTTLVRRHGSNVWRVCRAITGNPHDADDAFQATFLLLARKAKGLRSSASVGAWLYGVAYRIAVRAKARAKRWPTPAAVDPVAPATADELTVREAEGLLHEELARLPERYRIPLVLCCLEGLARDEAARQLGWSLNTLKSRLEYGRELLRGRLLRRGVTLTVPLFAALLAPSAPAGVPSFAGAEAVSPSVTRLVAEVSRMTTFAKLTTPVLTGAAVLAAGTVWVGLLLMFRKPDAVPPAGPPVVVAANDPRPAPQPAPDPKPAPPAATAEQVAAEFLKLVLAGETAKAKELCYPGNVSENKMREMIELGLKSGKLLAVIPNGLKAEMLAITEKMAFQVKENQTTDGHLVLMLVRDNDDRTWQVKDIDFEPAEKMARTLERYRNSKK